MARKKRTKIENRKEVDGFSSGLGSLSGLSVLRQSNSINTTLDHVGVPSTSVSSHESLKHHTITPLSPLLNAAKLTLRWTKKGRGGKSVTLIQGAILDSKKDRKLCTLIGGDLGCRASVEGENIAIQGDQRERVKAWLISKGIKEAKIITC